MPLDNPQEIFYWVNEQDEVMGKVSRKEAHNGSFKIHRTVGILVFDEENNILLQQRSLKKDLDPGFWTISAGGHVPFGASYDDSAKQEMLEELGITKSLSALGKYFIVTAEQKEWVSMYTTETPHSTLFTTDSDEVEQVKWVKKAELASFVQSNPFSPWAEDLLKRTHYL